MTFLVNIFFVNIFCVENFFWAQFFVWQNFYFLAKILFYKLLFFWSKKFLYQKKFSVEMFCNILFLAQKNFFVNKNFSKIFKYVQDRPRNLPLKFGQGRVSNTWDIQDMDKCRKNKYCLDKCHCYSWNMFKKVPGTYL